MISRILCLVILVIVSSFPVVNTLQFPPKAMAQVPPSEEAKGLVDDVIQALKVNDTEKAQVHLSILNQQLPTFVNSTWLQSVKILLDDTSAALKNNDVNNAIIHLNLVKQQLTPTDNNTTALAPSLQETTSSVAGSQNNNVQGNHPPEAQDKNIDLTAGISPHYLKLNGSDIDGNPITYSIISNPTHGKIEGFDSTSGIVTFDLDTGNDSFTYQVTDSHDAKSNIARVTIHVNVESHTEGFTDTNDNLQVSFQAPDSWNSGMAAATIHNLGSWRSYGVLTANDDLSAFFIIINLPPLANFGLPSFDANLLSQYVTLNSQYDLKFNGYSGHAYSVSVSSDQLSRLQSFLPSIDKDFSAVMITTEQKGGTYLIVYATEPEMMDHFQDIFRNMLNSVSFQPSANTKR